MSTRRIFDGGRSSGERTTGLASQLRKLEMRKGRSKAQTSAERYKAILNKKMEAQKTKTQMNAYNSFMLKGAKGGQHQMSKRAQQALKEIAAKKATKEAVAMRQMVVIKPRRYGSVGHINKKGVVYDHAGNVTLRVNAKNGKVRNMNGWSLGKYKPKSMFHESMMTGWIKKHSPYHIQVQKMELQRQMQAMQALQQQGAVSVHGMPVDPAMMAAQLQQMMDAYGNIHQHIDAYGNMIDQQGGHADGLSSIGRVNADVTAWGVRSTNVFGTFGENAHGGYADNVWGGTTNNIWGGMGDSGGLWKGPGRRMFGSSMGSGTNHLAKWAGMLRIFMGFGGRNRGTNGMAARGHADMMRNAGPSRGGAAGAGARVSSRLLAGPRPGGRR